jgi:hypothetical protein
MNKLLTKKIEELTLYLIEQNNQLKVQKANNTELMSRLKKIEDLVRKNVE